MGIPIATGIFAGIIGAIALIFSGRKRKPSPSRPSRSSGSRDSVTVPPDLGGNPNDERHDSNDNDRDLNDGMG